jgi:hypothetical protein
MWVESNSTLGWPSVAEIQPTDSEVGTVCRINIERQAPTIAHLVYLPGKASLSRHPQSSTRTCAASRNCALRLRRVPASRLSAEPDETMGRHTDSGPSKENYTALLSAPEGHLQTPGPSPPSRIRSKSCDYEFSLALAIATPARSAAIKASVSVSGSAHGMPAKPFVATTASLATRSKNGSRGALRSPT